MSVAYLSIWTSCISSMSMAYLSTWTSCTLYMAYLSIWSFCTLCTQRMTSVLMYVIISYHIYNPPHTYQCIYISASWTVLLPVRYGAVQVLAANSSHVAYTQVVRRGAPAPAPACTPNTKPNLTSQAGQGLGITLCATPTAMGILNGMDQQPITIPVLVRGSPSTLMACLHHCLHHCTCAGTRPAPASVTAHPSLKGSP